MPLLILLPLLVCPSPPPSVCSEPGPAVGDMALRFPSISGGDEEPSRDTALVSDDLKTFRNGNEIYAACIFIQSRLSLRNTLRHLISSVCGCARSLPLVTRSSSAAESEPGFDAVRSALPSPSTGRFLTSPAFFIRSFVMISSMVFSGRSSL